MKLKIKNEKFSLSMSFPIKIRNEETQEKLELQEKNLIADEMLQGSLWNNIPLYAVEKLKTDLSPLPLHILQTMKKFGIKIFITKGNGETAQRSRLNSGVFKEVLPQKFSTLTFVTKDPNFRRKLQEIDALYQPELEKKVENVLKLKPDPSATNLPYINAQENLQQLYEKMNHELDDLSTEFLQEKILIRRADFLSFALGNKAFGETIAMYHGASNQKEIKEYLKSVSDLNPDIAKNDRSRDMSKEYLFFPDFCYAAQPGTDKRLVISGSDYHAVKEWESQGSESVIEGMYIPSYKTVFLREEQLGTSFGGNNVTLHEIGHAYEDAVKNLDPEYYRRFDEMRLKAKHSADWNEQVITLYAGENANEFLAESFAACFSERNRSILKGMDESWFNSVQKFILHARDIVGDVTAARGQ
jgi:hypothetical protein